MLDNDTKSIVITMYSLLNKLTDSIYGLHYFYEAERHEVIEDIFDEFMDECPFDRRFGDLSADVDVWAGKIQKKLAELVPDVEEILKEE